MRGIVAYHQDIYAKRQMSNGVIPHVCATRGPGLRMANDVTFLCCRGGEGGGSEGGGQEGSCGRGYGCVILASEINGVDPMEYAIRRGRV